MITVLVCGSRTWGVLPRDDNIPDRFFAERLKKAREEVDLVTTKLDAFLASYPDMQLIEGGANGADSCGRMWAREKNVFCTTFLADWKQFGHGAGPVRNQQMLDAGHPDFVLAFSYKPITSGTQDMISRSEAAHVPTRVFPE